MHLGYLLIGDTAEITEKFGQLKNTCGILNIGILRSTTATTQSFSPSTLRINSHPVRMSTRVYFIATRLRR